MSIQKITKEQAEDFIEVKEDYTNSEAHYFTLTPSTNPKFLAEEGWDDVTYYKKEVNLYSLNQEPINSMSIY